MCVEIVGWALWRNASALVAARSHRTCSPARLPGRPGLKLEYDAQKNPAIWDQLLSQTPRALIQLGAPILAEQQRLVQEAVGQAFVVNVGGAAGAERGWGRCLAVRVGAQLASLRSQLGNALAEESRRQGLRAMAVVAYIEVRQQRKLSAASGVAALSQPQCL